MNQPVQAVHNLFLEVYSSFIDVLANPDNYQSSGYYKPLTKYNFPDLQPKKFIDSQSRKGLVVPVHSWNRALPNLVIFEEIPGQLVLFSQDKNISTESLTKHEDYLNHQIAQDLFNLQSFF